MELIRKIIVGTDPLKGMAYCVGQPVGSAKIEAIVLDLQYLKEFGKDKYRIFIKDHRGIMCWKTVTHQDVIVENDCNF
jgi:hypothetical protein